jgi:excisionase family DNA binding protein
MAERFSDEQIAATLNRLGLRTGADNTWNEGRVRSAREYQQLPAFDSNHPRKDFVTLREAAQRLGLSLTIVRRLIAEKKLPASQVIRFRCEVSEEQFRRLQSGQLPNPFSRRARTARR